LFIEQLIGIIEMKISQQVSRFRSVSWEFHNTPTPSDIDIV